MSRSFGRATRCHSAQLAGKPVLCHLHTRRYSTPPQKQSRDGPLKGVRILDFTRVLAGPFCTQILADYGADVIKVEQPVKGDETRNWKGKGEAELWKPDTGPMSYFFSAINRNKRSITLDLKKPEGKQAVHKLIEQGNIDVVMENFVPGAMIEWVLGGTICLDSTLD